MEESQVCSKFTFTCDIAISIQLCVLPFLAKGKWYLGPENCLFFGPKMLTFFPAMKGHCATWSWTTQATQVFESTTTTVYHFTLPRIPAALCSQLRSIRCQCKLPKCQLYTYSWIKPMQSRSRPGKHQAAHLVPPSDVSTSTLNEELEKDPRKWRQFWIEYTPYHHPRWSKNYKDREMRNRAKKKKSRGN